MDTVLYQKVPKVTIKLLQSKSYSLRGNTFVETTVLRMTPTDLTLPPTLPTELVSPSPLAPLSIPSLLTVSSRTPEPVVPVLTSDSIIPQPVVNSVNEGNQASIPQTETDGTPDPLIPTTFKIRESTKKSVEKAVAELNQIVPPGTPAYSVHSYGVELLTNHDVLRQAAERANSYLTKINAASERSNDLQTQLQSERLRNADLTAQLKAATDYINRLEHHPTPEPVQPPVMPQAQPENPVNVELQTKYNRLLDRYEKIQDESLSFETGLADLRRFVQYIPGAIAQLSQEAARNSWYTAGYYEKFFRELITPYLPTE